MATVSKPNRETISKIDILMNNKKNELQVIQFSPNTRPQRPQRANGIRPHQPTEISINCSPFIMFLTPGFPDNQWIDIGK